MIKNSILTLTAALLASTSTIATAQDLDAYKEKAISEAKAISSNSAILSKIKEQNTAHADLSETDIDAMDKAWRAEVKSSSFKVVQTMLDNEASKELVKMRENSQGVFGEIFVMDNKGLNVATSDVTSDYWQGDEAKWQETFLKGADAVHMSDVDFDESVQAFTTQISTSLTDEAGNVIGAVTFSVIMEE